MAEETAGIARPVTKMHDPAWRQMQKYRMARFKGPKIPLPGGLTADGTAYLGVRPPGANRTFMLHSPDQLLLKPAANHKYVWRLRNDDMTYGLVEGHQIIPVRYDNVDKKNRAAAAIYPYSGPGGHQYCGWGRFALFAVPPDIAYEWFDQPADWAMHKVMTRSEEFGHQVSEFTKGKMEGHIEVSDRRTGG